MKSIKFGMLMVAMALFTTSSFAQIRVVNSPVSGYVKVGNTSSAPNGILHVEEGTANLTLKSAPVNSAFKLMDVTTGLDGSMRMGVINPGSNSFGGAVFQAWSDNAPNHKGRFYFDAGTTSTAGIYFRTSANTKMVITQAGDVGIGVNAPSAGYKLHVAGNILAAGGMVLTSDKRTKKNVSKYETGLDAILQLNPINYQYNGLAGTKDGDRHCGIFAQELQEVAPELVVEFTHTETTEATIEEQHKILSEEQFLAIKDNEIKYMLINAIKEQQAMIEAQSERIAKLENQINTTTGGAIDIHNSTVVLTTSDVASLEQNKPNPFNGFTVIDYTIPQNASNSVLTIYDFNGKLIKSLRIDHIGNGSLRVEAQGLPSGQYSYSLVIDGVVVETKKMTLSN